MNNVKTKIGSFYLVFFSIIIIFILVLYFSILNVDVSEYFNYLLKTNVKLINDKLTKLINANAIVNLPNINLVTNDPNVENQEKCKNGAIFMGNVQTDNTKYLDQCKTTCGGNGEIIIITDTDEYYSNGVKLTNGVWCVVDKVECNMNTGYVVATINSVVCKTKFPNMFGGSSAAKIIACNNELYPSTGSVLWDYKENEIVDPLSVNMTHENETLPDGSFRFMCKYQDDINGNKFVAHPLNRFHPIRDACNKTIYRASREVQAIINNDTWYCDCGNYSDTRVRHLDPSNIKSTCTSCNIIIDKTNNSFEMPYNCFTVNSSYTDVLSMLPCIGSQFINEGNLCSTVYFEIQELQKKSTNADLIGAENLAFSDININLNQPFRSIREYGSL